jgi:hypothetical protein
MEQGLPPPPRDSINPEERKTELGLLPRVIAAGWFAGAACVPIVFFFLVFGGVLEKGSENLSLGVLWIFGEIPAATAAFFGFTLGSRIVDPLRNTSAWRAALQGIAVASLSYVVFMTFYIGSIWIQSLGTSLNMGFVLLVMLIGSFAVAWLVELSGSLAGWLLCRYSCQADVWQLLLNAPRVTVGKSYAMATVAGAIVVISCIVGAILLAMQAPKY